MGSTFVTLGRDAAGAPISEAGQEAGFWMRDGWLELWLGLLVPHLPLDHPLSAEMRSRWLVASGGGFIGCVPHDLDWLSGQVGGLDLALAAVGSLSATLREDDGPLAVKTLNLLGMASQWTRDVDRSRLIEIARAFEDLLLFRLPDSAASKAFMPGSAPEQGRTPR